MFIHHCDKVIAFLLYELLMSDEISSCGKPQILSGARDDAIGCESTIFSLQFRSFNRFQFYYSPP